MLLVYVAEMTLENMSALKQAGQMCRALMLTIQARHVAEHRLAALNLGLMYALQRQYLQEQFQTRLIAMLELGRVEMQAAQPVHQ